MKLKVCGLSSYIEVKTCVDNGVDYCGFILNYPKSHRYISLECAQKITQIEKKNSKYVGVLVNPNDKELEKYSKLNLDYFQIYGGFNNKLLIEIKKNIKKKLSLRYKLKKEKMLKNIKI